MELLGYGKFYWAEETLPPQIKLLLILTSLVHFWILVVLLVRSQTKVSLPKKWLLYQVGLNPNKFSRTLILTHKLVHDRGVNRLYGWDNTLISHLYFEKSEF